MNYRSEEAKMSADNANSSGFISADFGVNVPQAEAEFAELNRELSAMSRQTRQASKERIQETTAVEGLDLEKSSSLETPEHGDWNLETILRGARSLDQESGIKPKRVGVLWENLTVKGIGGVKNIVRTFPDAFISFFNVPETICHLFGWDFKREKKEISILRGLRGLAKPGDMVLVLGRPGSGCST